MYSNYVVQKVKKLSGRVLDEGCVVVKDETYSPSKTGLYVHKYQGGDYRLRNIQVERLGKFFGIEWPELLQKKIQGRSVRRWLNIDQTEIEYVLARNVLPMQVYYYGIDLSGPSSKITDLNSDRATVIGFQDEFCRVFSEFYFDSKFSSFYDDLVPMLRSLTSKPNPRVFVLVYEDEVYITPISRFCKKFGFKLGNINDYDPKNVDIVLRQVKSEEILGNKEKYKVLLDSLDTIPMVNPLGSYISGHKGWPTILSSLGLIDRSWFPNSWIINNDRILNSLGQSASFSELSELFLDKTQYNNRKNYVVKKGFGAGGRGVYIGEDLKRYEWQSLWQEISRSNETWIVEEKLPRNNLDIIVGDWGSPLDKIEVKKERLNMIERVYSTFPFYKFTGEVFGKNSNKVNASGYTFPVSSN